METAQTVYSKSKSLNNFLSELKSEGYNSYSRGGKVYGVEDESGRHYCFKTLGFDLNKLEKLDRQTQEEARQLQELASLRDSKSQDKEQVEVFEREIDDERENESEDEESNISEDENDDLDTDDSYDENSGDV